MSIFSPGGMQAEVRDGEVLVAMHMDVGNFVLYLMFSGLTDHTDGNTESSVTSSSFGSDLSAMYKTREHLLIF